MWFLAVAAEPPQVSLSPEKLVLKQEPQTLSCHSAKYYPLDVQVGKPDVSAHLAAAPR